MTKSGAGTLTLGGTGDISWLANVVNGGTLVLAKTDTNKATDNLTVNATGTVKLGVANLGGPKSAIPQRSLSLAARSISMA